jgi:VWFA-related protein
MRRSSIILAAALFVCGGPWLWAQQAGPPQQPFRSGVELVTVDVGVVDRQGQPVRNLEAADFVVTVGGQTRRVVTAEYVDVAATRPAPGSSLSDVAPISSNEGGGLGRLVVFVVDQSTLEPGDARRVGAAAARFFDGLTFADRSALMLMPVGPNVSFTWAHDRVQAALQRATGLGGLARSWEYGSLTEARDIANRQNFALRSVVDRECRGSIFASGGGFGAPPTVSGSATTGPTPPPPGGTTTGGGGTGTSPTGEAGAGAGAPRVPRTTGGVGLDTCSSNLQMQAEATWRMVEMTSMSSISAFRQVLSMLAAIRGDKTVILISGGWPMDVQEETSLLTGVAAEAATARATLFTLFVPGSTFSADRRMVSATPTRDYFLHASPLETLAGMTGGGSFRAEVGAEGAFERLGRELAGYYRIGVERDPSDLTDKARPMKVQVTRTAVTVRARELFDVRTYEDRDWAARLAGALDSPVPASGIGLRVTSYLSLHPEDSSQLKLVLTGEATRLRPGDTTFQIVVRDMQGRKVLEGEPPIAEAIGERLPFSTNVPLPPGSYIVRIAVMDSAGNVGSVDHRVDVKPIPIGDLSATGPLLVRVPAGRNSEPQLAMDAVLQDERLALELNLEGPKAVLSAAEVQFEIASTSDGPALVQARANFAAGSREGYLVAQGVADTRLLPPGHYVVRAKVRSAGGSIGEARRAFEVLGTSRPVAEAGRAAVVTRRPGTATLAARTVLGTVQPFSVQQVLAPDALGQFLDRIAERSDSSTPAMRDLLDRARTGDLRELTVSDEQAKAAPIAAFAQGLSLLAQNKIEPAAEAFRTAMRASADFYPAMVYLGACYAAGGNDRQAAGAWRTALIREGDVMALHKWLTDAQLRSGNADQALLSATAARERWPEDTELKRRYATAALMSGEYADGLRVVDELVAARADDEPTLALAMRALYDAFTAGHPVETVEADRARMIRLAEAYRTRGGPALPLVDVWVAAMTRTQ